MQSIYWSNTGIRQSVTGSTAEGLDDRRDRFPGGVDEERQGEQALVGYIVQIGSWVHGSALAAQLHRDMPTLVLGYPLHLG